MTRTGEARSGTRRGSTVAVRAEAVGQERASVDLDRDRALVLRYQDGDEAAFDELYRRYFPRLCLYCRRRVHDRHVAEELAQEAFLRALRAMPNFAGERRFYPWMTVIAQRLCIDHHRRSSRVEPTSDIDLGTVEADHGALFAEVDQSMLEEAMRRVAPRHREVLELRERDGWTYLQIAAHLDVPVTTVEALLHRARKALRREFLAVASGTRLAGLPVIGSLFTAVARARARLAAGPGGGTGAAAQLAPAAFAGIAVIGLALVPPGGDTTHTQTDAPLPRRAAIVAAPLSQPAPAPGDPLTLSAAEPPVHGATRATPKDVAPPPSAHVAGAAVYSGAAATSYWGQKIDEAPVSINLDPIAKVGLDPVAALNAVLNGGRR